MNPSCLSAQWRQRLDRRGARRSKAGKAGTTTRRSTTGRTRRRSDRRDVRVLAGAGGARRRARCSSSGAAPGALRCRSRARASHRRRRSLGGDARVVRVAAPAARNTARNVSLVRGDIRSLPFRTSTRFDLVIAPVRHPAVAARAIAISRRRSTRSPRVLEPRRRRSGSISCPTCRSGRNIDNQVQLSRAGGSGRRPHHAGRVGATGSREGG